MTNATDSTDNSVSSTVSNAVASVAASVRSGSKGRPLDPNSRLGQARAVFAAATDRSRKTMVAEFEKIPGITKPIASAYFHQLVNAEKASKA